MRLWIRADVSQSIPLVPLHFWRIPESGAKLLPSPCSCCLFRGLCFVRDRDDALIHLSSI